MIKAVEFPNREFATKEDLFKALVDNESKIADIKKAQLKNAIGIAFSKAETESVKGIDGAKNDCVYPIVSTTRYYDSHKDVHFDRCFDKTVKDQQGTVHYALDHKLEWDSIVAWKEDIRIFTTKVDWVDVGKPYEGETEALVLEIPKSKFKRKDVLEAILNKESDFENSIRMIYVKLKLGVNSDLKEHAEQKAYYEARKSEIANIEDVEKDGYFWGVEELRIHKEASLVVAGGSNSATSIFTKENTEEPLENTLTEDKQEEPQECTLDDFKEYLTKKLVKK
jgi:hypothetical protein